jgi:hypothetical protein
MRQRSRASSAPALVTVARRILFSQSPARQISPGDAVNKLAVAWIGIHPEEFADRRKSGRQGIPSPISPSRPAAIPDFQTNEPAKP